MGTKQGEQTELQVMDGMLAGIIRHHPERVDFVIDILYRLKVIERTRAGYLVAHFPETQKALNEHFERGANNGN
jgi:hypothetical protein